MVSRLLPLFFLLIFFSCKKNNSQYELSGHLKDAFEGNGIEGVHVSLLKQEVANGVVNAFYQEETSGISNSSGEFKLSWPNQQVLSYKIRLEKENFYTKEIEINPDELQLNVLNEVSYDLFAKSWLNLSIQSTSIDGSIAFSSQGTTEVCECEELSSIPFSSNTPLSLNCGTFGNGYLKYVVYDSVGNVVLIDSLLSVPFVTNSLQLSF